MGVLICAIVFEEIQLRCSQVMPGLNRVAC